MQNTCKIHVEYTFNNKSLRVNFDSIQTKNLIHPKFLHLQTNKTQQISGRLTIFSVDGIIYLFNKDKCVGGWKFDNMHEFQGKFSMELTSFYYGKNEKDWMGVFHASAVTNDKNAIMLTLRKAMESGNKRAVAIARKIAVSSDRSFFNRPKSNKIFIFRIIYI